MTASPKPVPLGALPRPSPEARALLAEFAPLVEGRASLGSQERIAYSRDQWIRTQLWARAGLTPPSPDIVLWPDTAEQVAEVVRRAASLGVPVVPFGAGTGRSGASIAIRGGVALDLKRLNRLREIDPERLEADCEAGALGEVLERRLNRHGLSLGADPGSMRCSTLGGWLAARGAGFSATRYGRIEERVASLLFVDGKGELHRTPRRPCPGWDLASLVCGSEGCLGVICAARLMLVPLPEARVFHTWRLPGFEAGLEAVRLLVRTGVRPVFVRLSDAVDSALDRLARVGPAVGERGLIRSLFDEHIGLPVQRSLARALAYPAAFNLAGRVAGQAVLSLAIEGPADLCEAEAAEAYRSCRASGGEDLGPESARQHFESRFDDGFLEGPLAEAGILADRFDFSVGWELAPALVEAVRGELAPLALVGCRLTRAWPEGCCIDFTALAAADRPDAAVQRHEALVRAALAAARDAGAISSHHRGVGLGRLPAFLDEVGEAIRVLRALKAHLDPMGILNPGKLGL